MDEIDYNVRVGCVVYMSYNWIMDSNLTDLEQHIMFEGGTEAPFSGELLYEKRQGNFQCKNCGLILFTSDAKFDSQTGWPSFTEPVNMNNIVLRVDESHGMIRTEVLCVQCKAHLGHVFDDDPKNATGKRYCINSACLSFQKSAHT
ncbi:MAG: peptide-methionine (R)-S-oxide reductase MsrB [Actinobacteria bacterium]|nr:peptide-methionine (R)-S-oxide reductase MsrB [Actinomycetota bacterium]